MVSLLGALAAGLIKNSMNKEGSLAGSFWTDIDSGHKNSKHILIEIPLLRPWEVCMS